MPQDNFRIYREEDAVCIDIDHPLSSTENAKLLKELSNGEPPFPKLRLKLHNGLELNESVAELVVATGTKSLNLGFFPRRYSEKTFQTLAGIIATNQLTNLELRDLHFGDKAIVALTGALSTSSSLQSLNLQGSELSDEGANLLATILRENHSLLSLNLGLNNITEIGLADIAAAMANNSTLQSLNLIFNDIKTLDCLEEMLRRNRGLKDLHLSQNYVDFEKLDFFAIANGLSENVTLDMLTLNDQRIKTENTLSKADAVQLLVIIESRKIAELPIKISVMSDGQDLLAQHQKDSASSLPAKFIDQTVALMEGAKAPNPSFGSPRSKGPSSGIITMGAL